MTSVTLIVSATRRLTATGSKILLANGSMTAKVIGKVISTRCWSRSRHCQHCSVCDASLTCGSVFADNRLVLDWGQPFPLVDVFTWIYRAFIWKLYYWTLQPLQRKPDTVKQDFDLKWKRHLLSSRFILCRYCQPHIEFWGLNVIHWFRHVEESAQISAPPPPPHNPRFL